jgi:hypothetical protein
VHRPRAALQQLQVADDDRQKVVEVVCDIIPELFIRLVLLGDLGTRLAYITLYPAVTIAAVIGGCRRLPPATRDGTIAFEEAVQRLRSSPMRDRTFDPRGHRSITAETRS